MAFIPMSGGGKKIEISSISSNHNLDSSTKGYGNVYLTIDCKEYSKLSIESFTKSSGSGYYREESTIKGTNSLGTTTLFSYAQPSGTTSHSESNLEYDISSYDSIQFYIRTCANGTTTCGTITFSNVVIE